MRFFLDAVFDPEHQSALRRYEARHKANTDEGRHMREDSIHANWDRGFGGRGVLTGKKLSFRVQAGREVVK